MIVTNSSENQNINNDLRLFKKVNPMDWKFINTEEFLCFDKEFDYDTKQFLSHIYDFYHIEPIHVHPRFSNFCNLLTNHNWNSSHIIFFHKGIESNLDFIDCSTKYIYIFSDKTINITIEDIKYNIKPNVVCRLLNKPISLKTTLDKPWTSILIHSNIDLS